MAAAKKRASRAKPKLEVISGPYKGGDNIPLKSASHPIAGLPRHLIKRTSGQMDDSRMAGFLPGQLEKQRRETEARQAKMSPAGALNLPPLLDARRLEFGLVDDVFREAVAWDRVYIAQVPPHFFSSTWGESIIVTTDKTQQRQKDEAPHGIIVGAGLSALDSLRDHGMDLGHIVSFAKFAPYRVVMSMLGTEEIWVHVIRAGDITGSEDLALDLIEGRARVVRNENGRHVIVRDDAMPGRDPVDPIATEEDT